MNEDKVIEIIKKYLETQFPKTCQNCGTVFPSYADYIQNATILGDTISYDVDRGIWQPKKPMGTFALRNCKCGSTLALTSKNMNRLALLRLMMWVRIEATKRRVTVTELFRHLRSEIVRRALDEANKH